MNGLFNFYGKLIGKYTSRMGPLGNESPFGPKEFLLVQEACESVELHFPETNIFAAEKLMVG